MMLFLFVCLVVYNIGGICLSFQTVDTYPADPASLATVADHSHWDDGNESTSEFCKKFHKSFEAMQHSLVDFTEQQQQNSFTTQQFLGRWTDTTAVSRTVSTHTCLSVSVLGTDHLGMSVVSIIYDILK